MLNGTFQKRFQELQGQSDSMNEPSRSDWQGWATSCQNLVKAVYGENSPHYINFTEEMRRTTEALADRSPPGYHVYSIHVRALQGIFKSAKEDFEAGYVFNVDLKISGEVFGNFVVLAKQVLAEGHRDVAAVLATAALEDALKRYANANGLNDDNRTMTAVINALKSKGLVSGAQKALLDDMPRIRNAAMHADWEKIDESAVGGVIGFVEQFLLTRFSQDEP